MTRRFKDPKKKVQLCQRPVSVSYEPKKGVDPLVEMDISESTTDVKTCNRVARYVMDVNGVPTHFCDRCYKQVTTTESYSGDEYGDPDEPCDTLRRN